MKGNLGRVGAVRSIDDIRNYGGHVDLADIHNTRQEKIIFSNERDNYRWRFNSLDAVSDLYNVWTSVKCNRAINSQTYMNGGSTDYSGPFDVTEQFFRVTPGNYKLYLAHVITLSGKLYNNDVPIGGVQILDAKGEVLHFIACNAAEDKWQTRTSEENVHAAPSLPDGYSANGWSTPANLTSTQAASSKRFSYASYTSSQYTGADNGISTNGLDTTPMTVGDGTMPQGPAPTQYMFRETSNPTTANSWAICRTKDAYAIPEFGSIRIAYAITIPTEDVGDIDPNGTFKTAFY